LPHSGVRTAMNPTHVLVYCLILTWIMIVTAALVRVRGNLVTAVSNRAGVPPATELSGRADRAATNMLENMVLFVGAWAVSRDVTAWQVTIGAQLFLVARLVYWPVYVAGIPVIRTGIWLAGVAAIGLMLSAVIAS